jgi:hypothetical protein
MGIYRYITVARKVFGAGHYAGFLHSLHHLDAKFRHLELIFSKRPEVDHRVIWVIIHVYYRRIINMNSYTPALLANRFACIVYEAWIIDGTQSKLERKIRNTIEPHT